MKPRKIISMIIIAAIAIACAGCSKQPESAPPDNDIYVINFPAASETTSGSTMNKTEAPEPIEIRPDFENLIETFPNAVGELKIKIKNDAAIDEIIMQAGDNEYYTTHDKYGSEAKSGAPFLDAECSAYPDTRSQFSTIYGHNLLTGEAFSKLTRYYPWLLNSTGSISQYDYAPYFEFKTAWDASRPEYLIFACAYTTADPDDNLRLNYAERSGFKSSDEFYEFMIDVMDRSCIYTNVDIHPDDEILALSTCLYLLSKDIDTRFAVFARRIRPGEDIADMDFKAEICREPLYFDAYYKIMGGSWPGRSWDVSKIKGLAEYLEKHPDA